MKFGIGLLAYDPKCGCYDFSPVFSPVSPLFSNADVAIANLETTLPGKNYSGYPAFAAPDSLVDAIKSAGINLLTTANTHCIDKGKDALIRTLRMLDEKGVPHLGTYASNEEHEKQRVFLLEKNGISVAMLNYTYGTNEIATPKRTVVNRIDKDQVSKDIAMAREKKVDMVIVLVHFGEEDLPVIVSSISPHRMRFPGIPCHSVCICGQFPFCSVFWSSRAVRHS